MNPTNGGPDSKGPCFRKAADTQQVLTMCGALRLPLSTRRPANPHFPGLGSAGGRPGPARACPTPSGLSFPSAPPTHSTPRTRRPRPHTDVLLRGPEPWEPQEPRTADLRPAKLSAEHPPLTSQAAEPRPTDGCACVPRPRPVPPPPAATPAQKEPAPAGFHVAQAHQLSRRAWGGK